MTRTFIILILTLTSINVLGQSAEELNDKSKDLIAQQKINDAIPFLKQAAELGSAEAQYNLGYCYEVGVGVNQNLEKAIEWYLKSSEQGFNDALYKMMMSYGNGSGVEQNMEKAFFFALKCAENDDATCMFNVINCYKKGMGTEKDSKKMLEWAIRLGKLENPENLSLSGNITSARLNLAYMYRDGTDVEKDLYKSYQWFLMYNEFKKDFSYMQQQQIVKEIQELEKSLTTDQIENGRKEAEKLFGRPLNNIENLYTAEL